MMWVKRTKIILEILYLNSNRHVNCCTIITYSKQSIQLHLFGWTWCFWWSQSKLTSFYFKFSRKFILVLVLFGLQSLSAATSNYASISCEEVKNYNWAWGLALTCYMKTVAISSTGLTIGNARNESVGAIDYNNNKRLQFLPENPANNFPNLEIIQASGCAIERIHRNNFRNLTKLKVLWLTSNPLEKISSDTFKDLTSLESLVLSMNVTLTIFSLSFHCLSYPQCTTE